MKTSLTQYGSLAEGHWREFCPKMVAALEAGLRGFAGTFRSPSRAPLPRLPRSAPPSRIKAV